MIHEIGVELGTALRGRGCSFPVVDGPEPTQPTSWSRERIVIERSGRDSYTAAPGHNINPRRYMIRNIGLKISIFAQSSRAGALAFEHERRAEQVLDMVLTSLVDIAGIRKNGMTLTGGEFVAPADLEKSESRGGAVYELTLSWERGVTKKTFAGAARPELVLPGGVISSRTLVSARGADDDGDPTTVPADAETACGA